MSTQTKSVELFSHHVNAGPRSFFFNVKRAPRGELFITVSELTAKENTWSSSKIVVPAEDAREFYMGLCEAIKAMRKADAEFPQAKEDVDTSKPAATPKKPTVKAGQRASGRASQGANRAALLR
jgi:hypothetical protein